METLRGSLLLAGGGLFDPNFRRAVVLVAEHGEEGALGLVLNRPATIRVQDAAPLLAGLVEPEAPLFFGGPVQREAVLVLAEFSEAALADRPVVGSIGFADPDLEPDLVQGIIRARVFAGYAGWGPGQLEGEMGESAWIVEPARPDDVFSPDPERLWMSVLRRKGGEYRMLSLMPDDPSSN
ncbi:MAG TPA: YqgE/AlgH family protein [Actinomycetota bacterium]|nr:YqgE/AlgH family protein [Actinomycetota bacterium]